VLDLVGPGGAPVLDLANAPSVVEGEVCFFLFLRKKQNKLTRSNGFQSHH
jgi:hypothetical protein